MRIAAAALWVVVLSSSFTSAQTPYHLNPDSDRASQHYRLGWEAFRAEHWDEAVKEFKQVIQVDATYKLAYYGLGRSYMGLKKFPEAAAAYEQCRDLYLSDASERLKSRQEADRIRQDDLDQLKTAINTLTAGKPTTATSTQVRQLQAQAQRIQNKRDALNTIDIASEAPPFVWLALGSAYFRATRFPEAEKAYKTSLEGDPKSGEAWNNLAALYLFTNRIDEADRAVTNAEKLGYAVNLNMKADIRTRKSGGAYFD